jgi:hypothetical protein
MSCGQSRLISEAALSLRQQSAIPQIPLPATRRYLENSTVGGKAIASIPALTQPKSPYSFPSLSISRSFSRPSRSRALRSLV